MFVDEGACIRHTGGTKRKRAAQLLALQLSPAPMAPARGGEGGSSQKAMVGSRRVASGAAVRNTPERARRSTCNGEGARLSQRCGQRRGGCGAAPPPPPQKLVSHNERNGRWLEVAAVWRLARESDATK